MRAAECEDFAPQVKNFVRQTEKENAQEKSREARKNGGLER
jgi:hypothetical protein